jgi:hypothetical protein
MKRKLLAAIVVMTAVPVASADAQWVFVARKAAQRIHHMAEGQSGGRAGYDFASVVLEAPADRVFAIALDHAKKNKAVRILSIEPTGRRLQVAEGDRTATLNVVELNDHVSQLLIAGMASPGEGPTASRVVQAVMRICAEMKKTCELDR